MSVVGMASGPESQVGLAAELGTELRDSGQCAHMLQNHPHNLNLRRVRQCQRLHLEDDP